MGGVSSFSEHLDRLLALLEPLGAPPFDRIVVAEIDMSNTPDSRGRSRVSRDALVSPVVYETRFEELLQSGRSWLNLSAYGLHEGALVVVVELPRAGNSKAKATSVNLSGPQTRVMESGWDVGVALRIV